MIADSIKFKGHRCFKGDYAGFDVIRPVNVIIGRNNTGKSNLLDLVSALCVHDYKRRGWQYQCRAKLREDDLQSLFSASMSGGDLGGNHWGSHGQLLVGHEVTWELNEGGGVTSIQFEGGFNIESPHGERSTNARHEKLKHMLARPQHRFNNRVFRRVLADRDIRSEAMDTTLRLGADGAGATNIIRRFITSSNPLYPRDIIQTDLLAALNTIFGNDGQFTEIQVQNHDEPLDGSANGHWEVFLGEAGKGLVSLSNSGSGLKTIFLVLLNLLVIPCVERKSRNQFVFAFEELENNLHPSLLRRLLQFIESYAVAENTPVFLTTHSSVALDLFSVSRHSQILHVSHDGEKAHVTQVSAHFDHLGVISELGAKPSDLLQANGIIWVEGPSDCIYLNRWLDIYSDNKFQEGRDYQIAFYGGSLLARTQFKSPEEAEKELVNLIRVNPHVIVVCDGDRPRAGTRLKDRVRRISSEVKKIPDAHIWVTKAREIENYVPGPVLEKALELTQLPAPGQYEAFLPRRGNPGQSFLERNIKRKSLDKMDLAILCAPYMTRDLMMTRFDWASQMEAIVRRIEKWNK